MREKLSVAAREVNMPLHEGLRLPEQFSAVINGMWSLARAHAQSWRP